MSLKHDLANVGDKITSLEKDRPDLTDYEGPLDKAIFKLGLQIKRLMSDLSSSVPKDLASSGVKLPRIEVPTFNGTS